MQEELQFVPQLNPREPFWIFPLNSASEIVQLLKKSVDKPSGSQESKSVLNKTTTHILVWVYVVHVSCSQEITQGNSILK